jgi:DNA-3-methyladenine glycosylase
LTQALALDGVLNGVDLCDPGGPLVIAFGEGVADRLVTSGPRVGLFSVPEPWKSIPWRFTARLNQVPTAAPSGVEP